MPAEAAQLDAFFYVALFVAVNLLLPEFGVCLGHYKVLATLVTVPKASVDKDDSLVFAQYNVGGTGQAFDVYAVAVAVGVQIMSHDQLGLCVLALDARHALVPLFLSHLVCHGAKILFSSNIVLLFL